jgi:hypothetical protein
VSRITAKRALDELVRQGRAFRQQGRGTFVAQARIRDISGFRSFSEDIRARGFRPSSQILDFREVTPEATTCARLHISEGEHAFLLMRLRLADQEPVAVETAYLPCRLCPGLLDEDLASGSLYTLLAEKILARANLGGRRDRGGRANKRANPPAGLESRDTRAGSPPGNVCCGLRRHRDRRFGLSRRPFHFLYRPPVHWIIYAVMDLLKLTQRLQAGLIVSCQASPGEPLFGAGHMAAMARAAVSAGAVGIRANGAEDIAAIRAELDFIRLTCPVLKYA